MHLMHKEHKAVMHLNTIKKFLGGNAQLQRKIFEITAKDAVHQFAETIKAVADYVGQEYTHGGRKFR